MTMDHLRDIVLNGVYSQEMLWVFLVLLATIALIRLTQRLVFRGPLSQFPGPWGFPVLGHLPLLGSKVQETLHRMSQKYGNIFTIRMGSHPTLVVSGYDIVRQVLEIQSEDFTARPDFYSFQFVNNGNSYSVGKYDAAWNVQNKIYLKAMRLFLGTSLGNLENKVHDEMEDMVRLFLDAHVTSPRDTVDMATGCIMYHVLYGSTGDLKQNHGYMPLVEEQFQVNRTLGAGANPVDVLPWLEPLFRHRSYMREFHENEYRHIKESRLQNEKHKVRFQSHLAMDYNDMLLRVLSETEGDVLSSVGINAEHQITCVTREMMSAATSTTSDTIQWALLYMAKFPAIQRLVQKEIDNAIGLRLPGFSDRMKLPYTRAAIFETLRFANIVPLLVPHCASRDSVLEGKPVPKGTLIFCNMYSVLRDPTIWENPDDFDPSRFLDEDGEVDMLKVNRVMVFGAGKRRCIGEQIARHVALLMCTILLQRCSFEEIPDEPLSLDGIYGLTVSPKTFRVKVSPRLA